MKNTAVNEESADKFVNDEIELENAIENLDNIQIHHRDEVLKRLANFKEKTNDF